MKMVLLAVALIAAPALAEEDAAVTAKPAKIIREVPGASQHIW